MSSPMKTLVRGRLYWAGPRHTYRGLILWTGKRHLRLFALNRFSNWLGRGMDD